jgi:multimeric flavodoxin WrbA
LEKLIISGSARKGGDTNKTVRILQEKSNWDHIDLNAFDISYYDYEHKNAEDDYIPLMREIIKNYDTLIFATPVYWYSMSGVMKVFFDRLSDLLTIEEESGRALKGKYMGALSCSEGNNLGEQFWLPFSETAKYMGMKFTGGLHLELKNGELNEQDLLQLDIFIENIKLQTENK